MNKVITDIEKNANEFIRAELNEFKGHDLFSFNVEGKLSPKQSFKYYSSTAASGRYC